MRKLMFFWTSYPAPIQRKVSGGNYGLKATLVILGGSLLFLLTSCFKQKDCEQGTVSYANPDGITNGMPKAPKSNDPCAEERAAFNTADSLLTYVYDPNVRGAIGPAASGIEGNVWSAFADYWGASYDPTNHTIIDTVYGMRYGIRWLWKTYGNPLPINGPEIQILYDYCGIDSVGYDDLQIKQGALDDCEKVSVPEYTPTFICNKNGVWESTNTSKPR